MTISFPINFEKMSGSGNDFVVIDNRHSSVALEDQPEFARKICRRMFSVGGNGLIFIENSSVADFSWRFYNGDGSVADMCGNGARCAARFAFRNGIANYYILGRSSNFCIGSSVVRWFILHADV